MGPNAMAGGSGGDDGDRGRKHKCPSLAERNTAKREKAKRAKRDVKGKGKATREDEEEDEEEKAAAWKSDQDARPLMPSRRFSAEDLQIINEVLEEIRAIDQEAAEEEFKEMEARHSVLPSVDPRESDEVNDETDSNKKFAGKQRCAACAKRGEICIVSRCRSANPGPAPCAMSASARGTRPGSRKSPKAKTYRRHREEQSPEGSSESEDDLRETQCQLDYTFEWMSQRKDEREVQMAALELTLRAILNEMHEQFLVPAKRPSWLSAALKKAEFFVLVLVVEQDVLSEKGEVLKVVKKKKTMPEVRLKSPSAEWKSHEMDSDNEETWPVGFRGAFAKSKTPMVKKTTETTPEEAQGSPPATPEMELETPAVATLEVEDEKSESEVADEPMEEPLGPLRVPPDRSYGQ
ncbi:hypothetical protein B0H17DRAFT_1149694 [Mycena rosella]|uniref:Uncharacterized protein n=1 Tax=Mycena rosella TaxID=1033263 RepID=A0AAD7FPH7_MYCRO|nr:hypothetical protein B0H17DRAFT_1149694 [Mycena rosella]